MSEPRREQVSERILIDAGRSSRGWSRIGNFFKCPQLFAYDQRLGLQLIPADALTRGSMGHVMQAHLHARWGANQKDGTYAGAGHFRDPAVFYEPEEAVRVWCDQNGRGHEQIDRMVEVFRRYLAQFPEQPGHIVAVEYPVTAVLGTRRGKWGLWVVRTDEQGFDRNRPDVAAADSSTIEITPVNHPGHPDHGKAVVLTRRIDLVIRDRGERTWIWDHKHQAHVQPGRSTGGYAIDGGFSAFRIIGQQLWTNGFGGVSLNLIQTTNPWRVSRPVVPPTPHRDGHFAEMLWRAEHEIARLDHTPGESLSPWHWPKAQSETVCIGRYGACAAIKLCSYGEAAVEDRHRPTKNPPVLRAIQGGQNLTVTPPPNALPTKTP